MSVKILFSPSETKKDGGDFEPNFIFPELLEKRVDVYNKYKKFLETASSNELSKLFGVKESSVHDLKETILNSKSLPAIYRYDGVAYDYLDFKSLETEEQDYILQNCLIFSNLFGPTLANDFVPNYKLKQGECFDSLKLEDYYKKHFSQTLDEYLQNSFVLDLRAGFYDKFYKPKKEFTTLKFLLNGKVVSHYAKAYRGLVMREMAKTGVKTKAEFMDMQIDNLKVIEIKRSGLKEEIVFSIQN
ncbi:MAG: hypothetical protein RL154_292 [Pseudomonadota bacterium]|jgi:cytoplasmic iron level regulating protein YaaA (DUF328/UPF0246 family)